MLPFEYNYEPEQLSRRCGAVYNRMNEGAESTLNKLRWASGSCDMRSAVDNIHGYFCPPLRPSQDDDRLLITQ
jgi:hypothetical protein